MFLANLISGPFNAIELPPPSIPPMLFSYAFRGADLLRPEILHEVLLDRADVAADVGEGGGEAAVTLELLVVHFAAQNAASGMTAL